MSYRTYVGTSEKNTIQILGNNESYQPLFEELKRQGIEINEDGCFEGKIKEIQPIIDILEQYIWDKDIQMKKFKRSNGEQADIFNLRPDKKQLECGGFTYQMQELQQNGYIFVTANLVNYLEESIEEEYDCELNRFIYKIKEDKEVWFVAF